MMPTQMIQIGGFQPILRATGSTSCAHWEMEAFYWCCYWSLILRKRQTRSFGKYVKQWGGEVERLRKKAAEISISRSKMWQYHRQLDFTLTLFLFWHNLAVLANTASLTHSWVWPLASSLASSSPYCWHSHLYSHMVNQSGEIRSNTILAKLLFSQTNSPTWLTVQWQKRYSSTRRAAGGHGERKPFFMVKTRKSVKVLSPSQVNIIHSFILLKAISRNEQKGGKQWKGEESVKINSKLKFSTVYLLNLGQNTTR